MGCIKPPLNVTDPAPRRASRLAFAGGVAVQNAGRQAAASVAVIQAADRAERVAQSADSASSADLSIAVRQAQRALSAARSSGASKADCDRLQAALSKIQRAEARARRTEHTASIPPAPPTSAIDAVLALRAERVDTASLLARALDNPGISAADRAELSVAMQKIQSVSPHAPGLAVEEAAGIELGRTPHGGSVWVSTVSGGGQVHGYAYEIIAASRFIDAPKAPGNGGRPVRIAAGADKLVFGQKLPAGANRRHVEADILVFKDDGHKIGIDTKNYARAFALSRDFRSELAGVQEAIRQGEVHEFHFAARGRFTAGVKEAIEAADANLRAELSGTHVDQTSTISQLQQALGVDPSQPIICWHEELG